MYSLSKEQLADVATILRRDSLRMTSAADSGHPTSCLSCAEIMSVLFFDEMEYDVKNALWKGNDEFILSKGHAAPIYYAALHHARCLHEDLFEYRRFQSPLEGHPMPSSSPWIKVATGSLGQGLSVGIGMALALRMQKLPNRVYILMGDSELAEGSVYEALQLASYYSLGNVCAIVDVNRLGQRGETMIGHNVVLYKNRFESFGWQVFIVDGHSISALQDVLRRARTSARPVMILAKTFKGKGVTFLQNQEGWHGKVLNNEELQRALQELPTATFPHLTPHLTRTIKKMKESRIILPPVSSYKKDALVATREAYGTALAALAYANERVIALDAEVSNSTFADRVKEKSEQQFIEAFIAEQNMIGMALGFSKQDFIPFASSFAAFLTRTHDQLRMAALSGARLIICGSHGGVSIGHDGASQMGLDDIALFRDLPLSNVFYPSDAVSTEKIIQLTTKLNSISYIRTTRPKTRILYGKNESFPLGSFKVLVQSKKDSVVLVGAGITVHEALKAAAILRTQGIHAAVVDLYCIKPFAGEKFVRFARTHGAKVIIAEDHYPEGGIGEMLSSELAETKVSLTMCAVRHIPHSGTSEQLLHAAGIDASSIVKAAKNIQKNRKVHY